VMQILGDHADPMAAAAAALDDAHTAISARPSESWGYFNQGTSATALKEYDTAAASFDEAFRRGLPFRMLWYQFGPYEAYYYTGRFYDVIRLADTTETITAEVEETKYWRGLAYAALGSTDLALNEFNQALVFNPHFAAAQIAREQVQNGTFSAPAPFVSNAIP
jgi:tetratricopeptide (TPR) repeat protein